MLYLQVHWNTMLCLQYIETQWCVYSTMKHNVVSTVHWNTMLHLQYNETQCCVYSTMKHNVVSTVQWNTKLCLQYNETQCCVYSTLKHNVVSIPAAAGCYSKRGRKVCVLGVYGGISMWDSCVSGCLMNYKMMAGNDAKPISQIRPSLICKTKRKHPQWLKLLVVIRLCYFQLQLF